MDAVAGLKRLQIVTLLLVLGGTGALLYDRLGRPKPSPGLDEPAVEAKVREALEQARKAWAAEAQRGGASAEEVAALRRELAGAQRQIEEVAKRPAPAAAAPGLRVLPYEKRLVCRIRASNGGLQVKVIPDLPADAWPFSDNAEPAGGGDWKPLAAGADAAIELGALADLRAGALPVTAIVRASRGTSELAGRLQRLFLACSSPDGPEQLRPLAGPFFEVKATSGEAGLKAAATSCVFAVKEGARLRLVLDAGALAGKLEKPLDIFIQAGPLLGVGDGAAGKGGM